MDAVNPKIIAGLTALAILCLVYWHQYRARREDYLGIWALAWTLFWIRYPLLAAYPNLASSRPAAFFYATILVAAVYLLLWGSLRFHRRPMPLWVPVSLAAAYLWGVLGWLVQVPFRLATAPGSFLLAAFYAWCGVLLLKAHTRARLERVFTALGFLALTIIEAGYSIHPEQPTGQEIGYALAASAELWVAVGLLLFYVRIKSVELEEYRKGLEESGGRMRLTLENMPVMLHASDGEGRLVAWNRECERITGYSAGDMLGSFLAEELLFPPPEEGGPRPGEWRNPDEDYLDREWPVLLADGSRRTISWSNVSRRCPVSGWAAWGVGVDVTRRAQTETGLRQLAAGVAHNFNNVLMAVVGNVQAVRGMLEGREDLRDKALPLLDNAVLSASIGGEMVERLTSYMGRDPGPERELEPVDAGAMVRTALDLAGSGWRHLGSGEVEFRTVLPAGLWVRGRRGDLLEVFLNLVKNAIEAMPGGGVLRVEGRRIRGRVEISFSDQGPGLDQGAARRIFDPFYTTKGPTGLGLGLTTSRAILDQCGGSLELEPGQGQGAVFTVSLAGSPPAAPPPRPEESGASLEGVRILLVEDEAAVAMGLEAVLTQAGCRVSLAGGVARARDELERDRPDLMICDLGLPDGTGWEAAKPPLSAGVRGVVFLTGLGPDMLNVPEADGLPPWKVLYKPVERRELLACLQSFL